mgnify:CR=1 FL=1
MTACLFLLGDGPERAQNVANARKGESHNSIKFLGKQEQMEDILPLADLFLLTSEYESFGLAALEAMAAEVPVISTNAGGLPEINIDGYSGYMSNVGDVDDMCKNALAILKDKPTHDSFKANALAQAKKFDISNIVPKYEKLYEGLL